ncbi:MAG: tyrosine-type recombinase/integrase [Gemmatimonadetes bacterium]|nr:tyrosine-type recombinase/integrase [Gemmatimonadota bacterium]
MGGSVDASIGSSAIPTIPQREVKTAIRDTGILKNASCHTFRHTFATQLLRDGVNVRTVQKLMGHADIRTTMIYLHAIDQIGLGVRSPLDRSDGEKRGRRR